MPLLKAPGDTMEGTLVHGASGTEYKITGGGFLVEDDDPALEELLATFGEHEGEAPEAGGLGAAAEALDSQDGSGEGTTGASEDQEEPALESLTVAELRSMAEADGISVPSKATKPEIIALLEAEEVESDEV